MGFDSMQPGESGYAKEMRRWNTPKRDGGTRPDGFDEFPKMLCRAQRKNDSGPYLVVDPTDENWTRANHREVGDAREQERAEREGWREGIPAAMAYRQGLDNDVSKAAAERENADRRMGEKAREEARKADEATFEHLAEIPVAPVTPKPDRFAAARAAKAAKKATEQPN